MRSNARFSLLALLVGVTVAVVAPAAAQAAVEIEKFVGTNCVAAAEKCGEKPAESEPGVPGHGALGEPITETVEPNLAESEAQGYRQAAGHVPFGITDFMLKHTGNYAKGEAIPKGIVTHVRVDVAAGLATSPVAVPQCTVAEFEGAEASPGFFTAPKCKEGPGLNGIGPESTVIGEETATVYVEGLGDVVLKGKLYNLVPPTATSTTPARSALYGAALEIPAPLTKGAPIKLYAHTIVEGNVEWGQEAKGTGAADYHDYFEVKVSPALPLIRSRQLDYGRAGNGAFITNATKCPGDNTTYVTLEGVNVGTPEEVKKSVEGAAREVTRRPYTTLLGLNGCEAVPFAPTFKLNPETKQQDQPDGITTELGLTRFPEREIDSSELDTASVALPEGLTINPSAAHSVTEACTVAQARIHSPEFGTSCPAGSKLGTVSLEVPTLGEPLTGNIYLGGEGEGSSITKPPFTVYLDAQTTRYGVDVRLKGSITPNETTGRLTATFTENPEQPFTNLRLSFNTGPTAPVANPLACGTATTETNLTPFTGTAAQMPASVFTVDSNNAGGACASPPPFLLTQTTSNVAPGNAGANTSFDFNLARGDGQQYLSQVKTVLPPGLVGKIATVPLCAEPLAAAGTCAVASQIGIAKVTAGSGSQPFEFSGPVYLTGPYNGAPFGLSIVVPAIAGPFNLGLVVTRATINVDPSTARVTITSVLPTIVKGIPLRLKNVNINVNRQNFLVNPTNCGAFATESTLNGFVPGSSAIATQSLSSPFQVGNCSALAFKPSFKAKTSARTSKTYGASLETTINEKAGQANIKSVLVQLPKQLPSRLTTLQKACPEATFASNPYHCPSGSFVGGARANTPVLSAKLKGPAILVSHGGEAFPDLDLVLEAEGVTVILVGNTKITNGITTTNFATPPDVPVSSITVNLPIGKHSALAANGDLCANGLIMPTTITGQNGGAPIKQNTKIAVNECGVRIVGRRVVGSVVYLTVQTFAAGRISGKGVGLATTFRGLGSAARTATLKVNLSHGGLRRGRPFSVRVRVGFVPKKRGARNSIAYATVRFR